MSLAPVEHVEVLVEEPSMEALLRTLLPSFLGEMSFQIYPHLCKEDLLSRLPERLAGYSHWIPPSWRIIVVLDRNSHDCHELKRRLEKMAAAAGLLTRTRAKQRPWTVVNRLAIEELEAWYFGDWAAVCAAYPRVPELIPARKGYRDPDAIAGGTWEAFERILKRAGYFEGGLRKVEAARAISRFMVPSRNTSVSFGALRRVLYEIASAEPSGISPATS